MGLMTGAKTWPRSPEREEREAEKKAAASNVDEGDVGA